MIASTLYRQLPSKKASSLRQYVTQRSLAVLLFVALAVVASVGNKPSDKKKSDLSTRVSASQSLDQQRYLSLNPRQLFNNIVRSVKEAFDDPELIQYAKEQGVDGCDSLTTSRPNTSQRTELSHSSQ